MGVVERTKKLIQAIPRFFGLELVRSSTLASLLNAEFTARKLRVVLWASQLGGDPSVLMGSRSQVQQDLVALGILGFKRNGFFVEFGATDGVGISNTVLLERGFGWSGILAEPGQCWHQDLRRNRTAAIDTRAVWKSTGGQLWFEEKAKPEYSRLETNRRLFGLGKSSGSRSYKVETISLTDLLASHEAPSRVDYLSIDTEGSEFEILREHDFDRYRFSVISVEHNYSPDRELIHDFLLSKGYSRELMHISQQDDFYIDEELSLPEGSELYAL